MRYYDSHKLCKFANSSLNYCIDYANLVEYFQQKTKISISNK